MIIYHLTPLYPYTYIHLCNHSPIPSSPCIYQSIQFAVARWAELTEREIAYTDTDDLRSCFNLFAAWTLQSLKKKEEKINDVCWEKTNNFHTAMCFSRTLLSPLSDWSILAEWDRLSPPVEVHVMLACWTTNHCLNNPRVIIAWKASTLSYNVVISIFNDVLRATNYNLRISTISIER